MASETPTKDAAPAGTTALCVILALAAATYLVGLGAAALLDNNEGLYAQVPREMIARGDWVTPRYDGALYLEKPPLLYWLIALSYRAFGECEWAARLVPALAALGTAAVVVAWTRRVLSPLHGVVAGIVLLTGAGFVLLGRTVMFDVLLTFWTTGALASLHLALSTGERKWPLLAGTALAGGVLTKGFVAAVPPLGALAAWMLVARGEGSLRRLRPHLAAASFVVVAAPWHVAASLATKEFPYFYFVNEHLLRFLGRRVPADFHQGPVWHYVPLVLLFAFPWTFLLPPSLVAGCKALRDAPRAARAGGPPSPVAFAFLSFVVPFVFFSVSGAKANYYMVVGAPALAVLGAAALLAPRADGARRPSWFAAALVQSGAVVAAAAFLPGFTDRFDVSRPSDGLYAAVFLAACVACSLPLLLPRLQRPVPIAAAACIVTWAGVWTMRMGSAAVEAEHSCRVLATVILANVREGEPVAIKGRLEKSSSLPFYVGRRIVECDGGNGDLEWGKRWEGPSDYFVDWKQLPKWCRRHPSCLIVGGDNTPAWFARNAPGTQVKRIWPAVFQGAGRAVWRVTSP